MTLETWAAHPWTRMCHPNVWGMAGAPRGASRASSAHKTCGFLGTGWSSLRPTPLCTSYVSSCPVHWEAKRTLGGRRTRRQKGLDKTLSRRTEKFQIVLEVARDWQRCSAALTRATAPTAPTLGRNVQKSVCNEVFGAHCSTSRWQGSSLLVCVLPAPREGMLIPHSTCSRGRLLKSCCNYSRAVIGAHAQKRWFASKEDLIIIVVGKFVWDGFCVSLKFFLMMLFGQENCAGMRAREG